MFHSLWVPGNHLKQVSSKVTSQIIEHTLGDSWDVAGIKGVHLGNVGWMWFGSISWTV